MFAHFLNVTPNLVSQWERGDKRPSGTSLKLLALVKAKGLDAIARKDAAAPNCSCDRDAVARADCVGDVLFLARVYWAKPMPPASKRANFCWPKLKMLDLGS